MNNGKGYLALDVEIFFRYAKGSEGRENFQHLEGLDYGISLDRARVFAEEDSAPALILGIVVSNCQIFTSLQEG